MTPTADTLVPDDLWRVIQPLLPTPPRRYGGRPRVDDRACLAGIVYQLRSGIPWRLLPTSQLGGGSPVTCWRRLRDWQRTGVCQQLHHQLLDQLCRDNRLDWSRASLDSISVRAKRGCLTGPNPTDRGKPGSKYHLLVDRGGTPLAVALSAANTHDSMLLEQVIDAVRPITGPGGRPGRPRKRPARLHGDKGYDYPRCRAALRRRGLTPRIARRGIEPRQRLGRHRYVVERSLAWLVGYRRLQVRYERRADLLLAFGLLACALVCLQSLRRPTDRQGYS